MTANVTTTIGQDTDFVVDSANDMISYKGNTITSSGINTLSFDSGLKNVYPSPAFILGMRDEIVAGLNATDNNVRALGNNHVMLNVTVLAGSGVVVVTGDSISESTGLTSAAATENITVDATGIYQTDAKWQRITNVTIPGGITGITYAIERLGYWDGLNNDLTIKGYRCEVTPTNQATVTFALQIFKVQDDGSKKTSIVPMEDIGLIGGGANYIDDNLRTAGDDRTYTTTLPFKTGIPHILKQTDFSTYFSSDENIMEGKTKHEGIYIELIWSNVDYYSLFLDYTQQT